jgi:hypothetical protein
MDLRDADAIEALVRHGGLRDGILRAFTMQEPHESGVLVIEMQVSNGDSRSIGTLPLVQEVLFIGEEHDQVLQALTGGTAVLLEDGCQLDRQLRGWIQRPDIDFDRPGAIATQVNLSGTCTINVVEQLLLEEPQVGLHVVPLEVVSDDHRHPTPVVPIEEIDGVCLIYRHDAQVPRSVEWTT